MDDPFAYFAICDENLDKSESIWFLNCLKCALEELLHKGLILGGDNFCLQSQFNPVFCEMMALDLESLTSPRSESKDSKGRKSGMVPLLGNHLKGLKKKRRLSAEANGDMKNGGAENKMDASSDANGVSRDFRVCMQKGGSYFARDGQKAKQIWRKHVLVVLFLDLAVCAALFGAWLYICRGFQCIDADG